MDNPTGTVVGIQHGAGSRRVTVDVDSLPACSRCARGKGCGAGVLFGSPRSTRYETTIVDQFPLSVGDKVRLRLAPGNLLGAAIYAYGAPLLGAVAAAVLAHGMALGDVAAAAASLAGIAAGAVLSRLHLRRTACVARFEPQIDKVL